MNELRLPPYSTDAEFAVIGSVLQDNTVFDEIYLKPEDFYSLANQEIYKHISKTLFEGQVADVVTISEQLESEGLLEDIGGMGYLVSIVKSTPSTANVKAYAKIVKEKSQARDLIRIGMEIGEMGYETEIIEAMDKAQSLVMGINEEHIKQRNLKDILIEAVDDLDRRYNAGGEITGLPTGYRDLDKKLNGLQDSDLIFIAGRPSMGKTTFAMNIGETVAKEKSVLVFSLEMSDKQLVDRSICSLGKIDFDRYRKGKLLDEEWPKMTSAVSQLNNSKLHIDDTPGLTVNQIRSRARKTKRKHGLDLIIIDYLQLMNGEGETQNIKVSNISRGLKGLAKELNIPVICLSQLNRNLENRPDKRPRMSDLRDSGAIEQDADVIIFMYRDEVYNEDSLEKGIAEAIIGKQRNGSLGTVYLTSTLNYCRFENFIGEIQRVEPMKPMKEIYG